MKTRMNRGISLVETVAAILLLAIAAAVAMAGVGSAFSVSAKVQYPVAARELGRDLLEEALSKAFDDPSGSDGETFVPNGPRTQLDDVDDYSGYQDSPPVDPKGIEITGFKGFTRRITVTPVAANGTTTGRTDATLLRVEVTVTWGTDPSQKVVLTGLKAKPSSFLPPPRSGLIYVPGSRKPGDGEHATFQVMNQTRLPITVSAVRVYWSPDSLLYFREFEVSRGKVPEKDQWEEKKVEWEAGKHSDEHAVAGQLLPFDDPFTFPPGGIAKVEIEHFRMQRDGKGPAGHSADLAFTVLWVSGNRTYQTDTPSEPKDKDKDKD